MALLWFGYVVCSGFIVYCGSNLSRYGDVIAEKSGLGRAWVGLVLLATVTSLPELITGISSVALAHTPDIALGDIMGSCVFNLAIIAVLDVLHGPAPLFSRADPGHILSAGFGIMLISTAAVSILGAPLIPSLGSVGLYTPAIMLIYAVGVRLVFLFEKKKIGQFVNKMARAAQYEQIPLRQAVLGYVLNSVFIVAAAALLPFLGRELAALTGVGQTFFGSVLIAATTSLPELVVSFSALKIGAADMAIANLLGSNMFNICILSIDDFFYRKGPLLSDVAADHAITGLLAIVMTGIAVVGLIFRSERKLPLFRLSWDAAAILIVYLVNMYLLYASKLKG